MEVASLLKDERVYSELALARPLLPRELRRDNVGVHAVLGAAFCKKNNLQMLGGGSHAVVVSGSLVVIIGALQNWPSATCIRRPSALADAASCTAPASCSHGTRRPWLSGSQPAWAAWQARIAPGADAGLCWPLPCGVCGARFPRGLVLPAAPTGLERARLLPSHDGRGIGAIAVHPAGSLLAVAERAAPSTGAPAVYLYEWPGLCVRRVLRGGTERSFAHLAFSPDGSRLATVGAAPDFLLAVWDWSSERLLLKAKAFAQDVFTVRFSQSDAGRLTTSGTGHIRFWRMAQTFTGLKLQGVIGKFGRVDLSDVTAFAEMPDGKVVSGSEAGRLLLWEGGFIKLTCAREDGGPAHDGDVGAVVLDRGSGCFVTGGEDGAVRWWPALPVEEAEGGEGGEVLPLKCMCEARVPCPAADGGGEAAARPGVVAMLRVETAAEIAATAAERGRLVAAAEQA
ncbi:CFAP44, partial [Symbiodinium sp. KB8]